MWNKQLKDEILLDVDDVARGYETRLRHNPAGQWVWSDTAAHEPLVSAGDFEAAKAVMAGAGRARQASRETHERVTRPYILRGRMYCGYCDRKMQGQHSHGAAYYWCRYPKEYALAGHVRHPANVYLREADVLPAVDDWLSAIFSPHRIDQTIRELARAQEPATRQPGEPAGDTQAVLADCDERLSRYQAALDAGADPVTVAAWTRQVKAERAAAIARDVSHSREAGRRFTEEDIRVLVPSLGDLHDVIRDADAVTKARIYDQLELRITYKPGQANIRAEITVGPGENTQPKDTRGDCVVNGVSGTDR